MPNLSQIKRQRMFEFLNKIREEHTDDDSLRAINEIENELISKKYGLVWEEHEERVDVEMQKNIPVFTEVAEREIVSNEKLAYNFLLEGDNLHSLKLLEKTHKGKIDVIYIDPPYNTGAKDWKYNNDYVVKEDGFRHSKWISMMNARLSIAKKLLKEDGVFICAIDENELATTLLLLNEIFGDAYAVDCITVVHNPRGVQGANFSYINEYAIFCYNKSYKVIGDRVLESDEIDWSNLRNWGSESERTDAKNCFYPIFVKDNEIIGFGDVSPDDFHPNQSEFDKTSGIYSIYPIDVSGIERKWRYARQSVEAIKHLLRVKITDGRYEIEIGKNFASYKTVWTNKKFDANEYGTQIINSMVPKNDFNFPKSLWNVYECLYAVIKNKPNAIVLDYFAGSGTTAHALMIMNNELKGNRSFILCTNNAVGEKKEKEYKKIHGEIIETSAEWNEWENKYGIASSVTYPRVKAAINGYTHSKDFKTILFEKKITVTDIKKSEKLMKKINSIIKENQDKFPELSTEIEDGIIKVVGKVKKNNIINGIPANLKYYKTDFIPKVSDDLEYSVNDELLKHISEMVQLEYAVKIDEKNYVLIMSDEEADNIMRDEEMLSACKGLYISASVLLTAEQQEKISSYGINVYIIPDYYFENELLEVGER